EKQWASSRLEEIFYIVDNIGSYTFAPYKVVWKRIAGAITGKAVSFECAVVEPMPIKLPNGEAVSGLKPVVPDDSTILLGFDKPDVAYYVCGILNSSIARAIIASYTYELRQETHILEYVNVPRYDPKSPVHKQISQLSRRAHELAKCIYAEVKPDYCGEFRNPKEELAQVEEQIDRLVAELYGMPEDALQDIRRLLAILKAEEAPEGGEVEEEALEPSIEFLKTDVAAGQRDYVEFNVVTVEECDKARITLQGPWGVKDLSLGEGRHKLEVVLPEGIYEVKYTFICGEHSYEGSFKVTSSKSLPTGPKRPSTLKLG
ncbi:MAG: hypothetical protein QXJ97_07445, partial [Desulfurococcaceae archaeon]